MRTLLKFAGLIILVIFFGHLVLGQNPPNLVSDPPDARYCQGQSGVVLGVSNSEQGVFYNLQKNIAGWNTLTTIEGNDGTVWYDGFWDAGSYRVQVENPPFTSSQVIVQMVIFPEQKFNIVGGGGYCEGFPQPFEIGLDGSQTGNVTYRLYRNGSIVPGASMTGTGGPITFGFFNEPGEYTSTASRNNCSIDMNESVFIDVFDNPNPSFQPLYFPDDEYNCSTVEFINLTTDGTPPYSFIWDFGDGTPTSNEELPIHTFPAFGVGNADFTVTLIAIDSNGCTDEFTDVVTVTRRPDASLIGSGFPNFTQCTSEPNAIFELTITNNSSTISTNENYWVDWYGDGTLVELGPGFTTAQHTYTTKGAFPLTFVVLGENDCYDTRIYTVFNGSNPTMGMVSGESNGCAPFTFDWTIPESVYNNTPSTVYIFDFGDGTEPVTLSHDELPVQGPDGTGLINHIYQYASCYQTGLSFVPTATAINPCQTVEYTMPTGVRVSTKANASFDIVQFPNDPIFLCVNQQHQFLNYTNVGCFIQGEQFTEITNYYWNFGDGTGTSTQEHPFYTYQIPGIYQVTLVAHTAEGISGNCGTDTIVRTICVQDTPNASFSIDITSGCAPFAFTPNNSSTAVSCANINYQWYVSPNQGFEYANNTNSQYAQPDFVFNEAGVYELQLRAATNSMGVLCGEDFSEIVTIEIFFKPEITLLDDEFTMMCETGSFQFDESHIMYNNNLSPITQYNWTVQPAGPIISDNTTAYPQVTFNDYGNYQLTVMATNNCGDSEPVVIEMSINPDIESNVIWYDNELELCIGMFLSDLIIGSSSYTDPPLEGGDGNNYSFLWEINTGGGWQSLGGDFGSDLLYTDAMSDNPTLFRRKVESGGCESISNVIQFTVYPQITNNYVQNPSPQHLCAGEFPNELIGSQPSGGNDLFTFLWEQSTDCSNPDSWIPAIGVTNDEESFLPEALFQTTCFRRTVYSVDNLCFNSTENIIINVYGEIQNNVISHPNPIVCEGELAGTISGEEPNQSGHNIPMQFNWEYAVAPDWEWLDAGGTGQNYSPGELYQTTRFRRVAIAANPVPENCNSQESDFIEFTVNPKPSVDAGDDQITFNGGKVDLIGTAGGGSEDFTILWMPEDRIESGQGTLNATTFNLYPPPNIVEFTLRVTDNESGCFREDNMFVTISGQSLSCTVSASTEQICIQEAVTLTGTALGGSGVYSYNWTLPDGSNLLGEVIDDVPSTVGPNIYLLEVDDGASTTICEITIQVDDLPVVTSPPDTEICSGTSVDYQPTADIPESTFNWYSGINPLIIGAGSGEGVIDDILYNSSNQPQSITYYIIPTGPQPTFCEGDEFELTVLVNPTAQIVDSPSQQTVVSGQHTTSVIFNSSVIGTTYEWFADDDCTGLLNEYLVPNNGNLLQSQMIEILDPNGPETCIINYYITPVFNGCSGVTYVYTIFVQQQPILFNVSGGGEICQGTSTNIYLSGSQSGVNYQLYRNGTVPVQAEIEGNGDPLTWTNITQQGIYTIFGINQSNMVEAQMEGVVAVIVNPLPALFQIQPQNDWCAPVIPKVSGSDIGVRYQLLKDGQIIQHKDGTGHMLQFDEQSEGGIYTVKAINLSTSCQRLMIGQLKINPKPLDFTIYPAGVLCEGDTLCLEGWEVGVEYQLWKNNLPYSPYVTGITGEESICFPPTDGAGVYSVYARFIDTECGAFLSQSVVVNEKPFIYGMVPDVCCPGCEIKLEGWQEGIDYYLYFFPPDKNVQIFGPVNGIPGEIVLSFGTWENVGFYKVRAESANGCSRWMEDQTEISPAPYSFQMKPVGWGCQPDTIKLIDSEVNTKYRLFRDIGDGPEWFGIEIVGTGDEISFGWQDEIGVYTISAFFSNQTGLDCWSEMEGSYEIVSYPTTYNLNPNSGIHCACRDITLNFSDAGVSYFLKNISTGSVFPDPVIGLPGTGEQITWTNICEPGEYYAYATNNLNAGCTNDMNGAFALSSAPQKFELIADPGSEHCEGTTGITLRLVSSQNMVVQYQLFKAMSSPPDQPLSIHVGNGGPLEWTNITAGEYYVIAAFINDPLCSVEMLNRVTIEELPLPTATLNNDETTICEGDEAHVPIVLEGDVLGWEVEYELNGIQQAPVIIQPGDPQLITIPNVIEETVVTLVSVKYDGDPACEGIVGGDFTVKVDPLPYAFAGADQSVCLSDPFTIPDADTLNISDFEWQVVNPLFGLLQDAATLTPTFVPYEEAANNFVEITLIANGANACDYQQALSTITLWVDSLPAVQAGQYDPMCSTDQLQLDGQAQNFNNPVWEDLSGLGSFDDINIINPVYSINDPDTITEPATIELTLSVDGFGECGYHSVTSTVLIEVIPTPQNVSAGNDSLICASAQTITMAATAQQYGSIQWVTSGNGTFNDPSALLPEYEIDEIDVISGSVELCVEAMPLSPCDVSVSDCMTLYFEPLPEVDLGADATICENASFNLINNNVVALHCDSIIWYGGDGLFDDRHISMPEYTPGITDIANGSVELCMTAFANSPCALNDSVFNCMTLYFQPLPEVNAGTDQTVCESQLTLNLAADVTDFSSLEWVTYPENVGSFVDPAAQTTMFNLPDVDATMLVHLILIATGENECSSDLVSDTLMLLIEPSPEVFAGNDLAVCVSNHVQIKDADTAYISDFLWEIISGSGNLDDPERFDPTYYPASVDAGTIVEVKLTASGYAACTGDVAEDIILIAVDGLPEVEMTQTSGTVCVSDPDGFTIPAGAVSLNNVSDYQWHLDLSSGFGQIENAGTLTPTYFPHQLDAGKTVDLKLAVKGTAACSAQADTSYFQIKIGAKPVVYFEPQNDNSEFTLCKNQPSYFVDFTDFGYFNHHPDQIITNRIWIFDETDVIDTSNETTVEYTFTTSGEHTVTLIVQTEIDGILSCTDSTTLDIIIYDSPVAGFKHERTNYCNGSLKFTDTSFSDQTTIVNWWWQFNNDYYSDLQHPEFEFESGGEKVISLQVTDARGCISTVQDTIYIEDFFDFNISYTGSCFGEPVSFEVDENTVSPEGNSIVDFEWSFGDGSETLKLSNPHHIYQQAGSYEAMLKAIDETGCEIIKTINVIVPEPLEPDISFIDCSPSVTFTVFSNYSLESYEKWEWDFGDGTEMTIENPDSEFITHDYEVPGIYSVHLIVTDTLGCVDTVSVKNIRNECFDEKGFFLPNAFAPEHPNDEVSVFMPKGVGIEEFSVKVFDMWGNLVWESSQLDENGSPVEAWDGTYKNEELPGGTYIYKAYAKFRDGTLWGNTISNPKGDTENITGTILLIR